MFGSQIGSLKLTSDDGILFEKNGRQENAWLYEEITLPRGIYQNVNLIKLLIVIYIIFEI